MSGIHFFSHTQLLRSLCGWVQARFSSTRISNADHHNFLSIIQAFNSFYAAAFSKQTRKLLHEQHPSKYFPQVRIVL